MRINVVNGQVSAGELGADATLTEQFVRMGLDELSVAPSMVLKLRKIVREMKVEE